MRSKTWKNPPKNGKEEFAKAHASTSKFKMARCVTNKTF